VAVNPFKVIPSLYTTEMMQQQLAVGAGESSDPHIFGIAAAAFRGVKSESADQAIIISGESGAGKTEATKKCLQFLASAAGSATGDGMEKRLLAANPILEAFGNAKTVRNNNSSRFGKWMLVHFNVRGQICGSQIVNYLLEKSRVTAQAPSERNYHGFYQLCASGDLAAKYELGAPEEYELLSKSGCTVVPGMADDEEFALTCDSIWEITNRDLPEDFGASPRPPPDYECIMELVAAVLHIGNIRFEALAPEDPRSECRLAGDAATRTAVAAAAKLLGVDSERMGKALTQQERQTKGERTVSPLELPHAEAARASLAKTLYGRMFDWLVTQVNVNIAGDLSASLNAIGVLDIFGFEIFEHNSFEQLCINFCNEKLQQHFNAHVFKQEEKCYIAEGIDYSEVEFEDNQDVLDVIEKAPTGILIVLDDQTKARGSGTDMAFLNLIKRGLSKSKRFVLPSARERGIALPFGIQHYAGKVMYDADGFLEKNKDEMMLQLRELCSTHTTKPFIQELFKSEGETLAAAASASSAAASPARRRQTKDTQGSQFRKQLDSLMKVLNKTYPHYVRCVKSNSIKKPRVFEAGLCLRQLRYAGVFEAVKIRQRGFPFRWTHDDFYKRYRCCARERSRFLARIDPAADFRALAQTLIDDLTVSDPDSRPEELVAPIRSCKMGKTMVLYRAEPNRVLEMMREVVRRRSAAAVCRVYRGHGGRVRFRVVRAARDALRAATASRDLIALEAALEQAAAAPFQVRDVTDAERLAERLREERDCRVSLGRLDGKDPLDAFDEYKAAIEWADKLELDGPDVRGAKERFATVRDRREAKDALLKGIRNGDRELIEAAIAKVQELAESWGPIVPEATLNEATATLEVIRKEDEALASLRDAVSRPDGGLVEAKRLAREARAGGGAPAQSLDLSRMDCSALEAALRVASSASISTKVGSDLVATATMLIDLRQAFVAGPDWARVEDVVTALVSARDDREAVSREALAEVARAESEVNERRFVTEVEAAMARGRAEGPVGALDVSVCDPDALTPVIERGEGMGDDLSPSNIALLEAARLIRRLRVALRSKDFASVRRCVGEAMKALIPAVAVAELNAAKDEADDHVMCAQLQDALSRGGAEGSVGDLDASVVEVELLNTRLQHAADLGPQTERAEALYDAGEAVLRLRAALRTGARASLPALVLAAERAVGLVSGASGEHVPGTPEPTYAMMSPRAPPTPSGPDEAAARRLRELVPALAVEEVRLVRQDLENETILRALREALQSGAPAGRIGAMNVSTVNEAALQAAVTMANSLQCRTDEARWLLEVAESLAELRAGLKLQQWSRLQELVGAVRAMDGVSPTRFGGSSTGRSRVVSAARRANPTSVLVGLDSFRRIANVAAAAAAVAASRSGRRNPPSPGDSRSSAGPSRPESPQQSIMSAGRSRSGSDASGDRNAFRLDQCVADEIALVQGELDNRLILETVSRALAGGHATGPIGELDWARVEVDDLEVSVARAGTLRPATRDAAIMVETGLRVLVLRRALQHGDWAQVEIALAGMALSEQDAAERRRLASDTLAAASAPSAAAAAATASAKPGGVTLSPVVVVSPVAVDEVRRVREETAFRRVLGQMAEALGSGAPRGVIGDVDPSEVSTAALESAIDAAGRSGTPTRGSAHLLELCRLVWKLRRSVMEGQWDHVEALLDEAVTADVLGSPTRPLPHGLDVPAHTLHEVALLRGEAENRRAVRALTLALEQGRPSGDTGHLNLTLVDARPLEEAVELAVRLRVPTADARCLVATCVHVRACRLAVMAGQWDHLERLLVFAEEVRRRHGPGPLPFAYQAARAAAEAADPGLPPADASVRPAVAGAVVLPAAAAAPAAGKGSEEATRREARRLLDAGAADDGLGAVLEEEEDDEDDEEEEDAAATAAQGAGATGPGAAPAASSASAAGAAAAAAPVAADHDSAPYPGEHGTWRVLFQLMEDMTAAWHAGRGPRVPELSPGTGTFTVAAEGLAREALPELRVCRSEVNNRNTIVALARAVTTGAATGTTGHLDVSGIELDSIDAALELSKQLGLDTAEARQMADTARVIRGVRRALKAQDWAALEAALVAAQGRVLADVVADEVRLAQDELDNRAVLLELQDALGRGRAQGETGRLYTGSIELRPLEEAIELANRLGCRTPEARHMLFSARVCLRLRHALLSGDFKEAQLTLDAVRGKPLATVALSEVRTVQDEVDNWAVVSALDAALCSGGAGGPVGGMDLSLVETQPLRDALSLSDSLGVKTREAQSLVVGGRLALDLRLALQEGDWRKVDRVVRAGASASPLAEAAAAELSRASDELDDRRVITALGGALEDPEGSGAGAPGAMDLSAVDTSRLDRAVATAVNLGVRTAEAERLLAACKLIRRLRSTLLARNWDWVGSVLEEARSQRNVFPEASLRELQLAQDELDNRLVLAKLAAALRSGSAAVSAGPGAPSGLRGGPGTGPSDRPEPSLLDLDAVDPAPLDDAIDYAESLGCRTIEASQMLATARLVRRLRQALLAGDLERCRGLLEGVRGRVLAAVAAEEVQAIKHEVDDWTVVSELTAAIATGAAVSGPCVGDVDMGAVSTAALDAAIPVAMRLGCRTTDARRALETALVVRRARQALLDADWPLLREALTQARDADPAPAARPELAVLTDELELRDVLEELRRASDDLNEDALGTAVSRAARLGLAAHPRSDIRSPVEDAQSALDRLQRCKASLGAARRAMSAAQLVDALAMAASVGYDGPLVEAAREALSSVRAATEAATVALRVVDTAAMEAALARCESLGVSLPLLAEIRHLLALPRHEYLHRQLAAAVRQSDESRVAELTMEIKGAFYLGSPDTLERFAVHRCPLLKPPHLFSSYPLSAPRLDERMASWQSAPASTSLTRISDTAARRTAIRAFRSVQAFMGDRASARPLQAGREVVAKALEAAIAREAVTRAAATAAATGDEDAAAAAAASDGDELSSLADEIILQALKQMTRNPHPGSRRRGWALLDLLLGVAPPSEELEHFVEAFLRRAELSGPRGDDPAASGSGPAPPPSASVASARLSDEGAPPLFSPVRSAPPALPVSEAALARRCLRTLNVTLFRGPGAEAPDLPAVAAAVEAAGAPPTPTLAADSASLLAAAALDREPQERVPATWESMLAVEAGRPPADVASRLEADRHDDADHDAKGSAPPTGSAAAEHERSPPPAARASASPGDHKVPGAVAAAPAAAWSPAGGGAFAPAPPRASADADAEAHADADAVRVRALAVAAAASVGAGPASGMQRRAPPPPPGASASDSTPPPGAGASVQPSPAWAGASPASSGGRSPPEPAPRAAAAATAPAPAPAPAPRPVAAPSPAASHRAAPPAPLRPAAVPPSPPSRALPAQQRPPEAGAPPMGMVSFGEMAQANAARRRKQRVVDPTLQAALGDASTVPNRMAGMSRRLRGVN